MNSPGMLMVLMEPAAGEEAAFHDWFDLELVPDHTRVAGFQAATRWVCTDGWPRYMSCYDVDPFDTLEEDAYRSITGQNFSPWSQWMLARVFGRQRLVLREVTSGRTHTPDTAWGLVMLRFRGHRGASLERILGRLALPSVCQARVFETSRRSQEESAIIIDAPAAALIPTWSAAELAEALAADAASLMGVWRYTRYVRSQSVWRWEDHASADTRREAPPAHDDARTTDDITA
jgi:hypothetical protein